MQHLGHHASLPILSIKVHRRLHYINVTIFTVDCLTRLPRMLRHTNLYSIMPLNLLYLFFCATLLHELKMHLPFLAEIFSHLGYILISNLLRSIQLKLLSHLGMYLSTRFHLLLSPFINE